VLSIQRVGKRFGGVDAVRDCSFEITRGSITGLIGPNGAGKTTLFNMIAGALRPSSGRIVFDGKDVTGLAADRMFHLGIVRSFQIPHELAEMTVLENLMFVPPGQIGETPLGALLRGGGVRRQEATIKARADATLEFLGLTHLRGELAGRLSGGQLKLLELGRTMMTDARLVLLDEPAAGVNRTLLGKILEMIRTLNSERGYTFCIIEHDMDVIATLCDPVVCMAQGTVLVQGTMDEVRRNEEVLEAYLGNAATSAEVAH